MVPAWVAIAGYLLQAVAAVLAVSVARRRAFHKSFAAFAVVLATTDVVHAVVLRLLVTYTPPYVGTGRILFHLTQACVVVVPVALASAAWSMVRRGVAEHLAGAGALVCVVLWTTYPTVRGPRLQFAYALVHFFCQVGMWAAIAAAFRKGHAAVLPTHALLIATVAADLTLWVGPFMGDMFTDWHLTAGAYLALQASTIAVQAAWLRSVRG